MPDAEEPLLERRSSLSLWARRTDGLAGFLGLGCRRVAPPLGVISAEVDIVRAKCSRVKRSMMKERLAFNSVSGLEAERRNADV